MASKSKVAPRGRSCALLLVCALAAQGPRGARGWVLNSIFRNGLENASYADATGARWIGDSATFQLRRAVVFWGQDELRDGITWALQPALCEAMRPQFTQEALLFGLASFYDCGSLRRAFDTAFSTWSLNNPLVRFRDVTDRCARQGVDAQGRCPGAELTVRYGAFSKEFRNVAAFVQFDMSRSERRPKTSLGTPADSGSGAVYADMWISSRYCWYLDATFCYAFHRDEQAVVIARYILVAVSIASGLAVLAFLMRVLQSALQLETAWDLCEGGCGGWARSRAAARARMSRRENCGALCTYLASLPLLGLLAALLFASVGPVFYINVFLPCVECMGFESTIAHEAGHVLGFHHPDEYPTLNLALRPGGAPRALEPGSGLEAERSGLFGTTERSCAVAEPLLRAVTQPVSRLDETFMASIAAHRPQTCLTADDFEGLNALYPPCEMDDWQPEPSCVKPVRLVGYLRLLTALVGPFAFCATGVLLLGASIRWHQRRQLKRLRHERVRRRHQSLFLRAAVRANWANAKDKGCERRVTKLEGHIARARDLYGSRGAARVMVRSLFSAPASAVQSAAIALTPRLTSRLAARAPCASQGASPGGQPRKSSHEDGAPERAPRNTARERARLRMAGSPLRARTRRAMRNPHLPVTDAASLVPASRSDQTLASTGLGSCRQQRPAKAAPTAPSATSAASLRSPPVSLPAPPAPPARLEARRSHPPRQPDEAGRAPAPLPPESRSSRDDSGSSTRSAASGDLARPKGSSISTVTRSCSTASSERVQNPPTSPGRRPDIAQQSSPVKVEHPQASAAPMLGILERVSRALTTRIEESDAHQNSRLWGAAESRGGPTLDAPECEQLGSSRALPVAAMLAPSAWLAGGTKMFTQRADRGVNYDLARHFQSPATTPAHLPPTTGSGECGPMQA